MAITPTKPSYVSGVAQINDRGETVYVFDLEVDKIKDLTKLEAKYMTNDPKTLPTNLLMNDVVLVTKGAVDEFAGRDGDVAIYRTGSHDWFFSKPQKFAKYNGNLYYTDDADWYLVDGTAGGGGGSATGYPNITSPNSTMDIGGSGTGNITIDIDSTLLSTITNELTAIEGDVNTLKREKYQQKILANQDVNCLESDSDTTVLASIVNAYRSTWGGASVSTEMAIRGVINISTVAGSKVANYNGFIYRSTINSFNVHVEIDRDMFAGVYNVGTTFIDASFSGDGSVNINSFSSLQRSNAEGEHAGGSGAVFDFTTNAFNLNMQGTSGRPNTFAEIAQRLFTYCDSAYTSNKQLTGTVRLRQGTTGMLFTPAMKAVLTPSTGNNTVLVELSGYDVYGLSGSDTAYSVVYDTVNKTTKGYSTGFNRIPNENTVFINSTAVLTGNTTADITTLLNELGSSAIVNNKGILLSKGSNFNFRVDNTHGQIGITQTYQYSGVVGDDNRRFSGQLRVADGSGTHITNFYSSIDDFTNVTILDSYTVAGATGDGYYPAFKMASMAVLDASIDSWTKLFSQVWTQQNNNEVLPVQRNGLSGCMYQSFGVAGDGSHLDYGSIYYGDDLFGATGNKVIVMGTNTGTPYVQEIVSGGTTGADGFFPAYAAVDSTVASLSYVADLTTIIQSKVTSTPNSNLSFRITDSNNSKLGGIVTVTYGKDGSGNNLQGVAQFIGSFGFANELRICTTNIANGVVDGSSWEIYQVALGNEAYVDGSNQDLILANPSTSALSIREQVEQRLSTVLSNNLNYNYTTAFNLVEATNLTVVNRLSITATIDGTSETGTVIVEGSDYEANPYDYAKYAYYFSTDTGTLNATSLLKLQ